jgi:hypothetical protein
MDCWRFKKCGREQGGVKSSELGVCPAFRKRAGEACWLVAGTFCGGQARGSFAQKAKNCMPCDFYKRFDLQHRSKVGQRFARRLK